jgi:hypothetical protein
MLGADLLLRVDLLPVQFVLECLDLLDGQGILHGDGHLVGHVVQEMDVRAVVGAPPFAPQPQHAKATTHRCQGQITEAADPERLHPLLKPRPACELALLRHDQGLLGLQHVPVGRVFKRKGAKPFLWPEPGGLQDVHARGIASGIKQNEGQKVETHHELKAACQLPEQSSEVPVPNNGFRDRQQRFVLQADRELPAVLFEVTHNSLLWQPWRSGPR